MAYDEQPYTLGGNTGSDQAEPSSANRGAGTAQMRVLIELQVISYLLNSLLGDEHDLEELRQDAADSIT